MSYRQAAVTGAATPIPRVARPLIGILPGEGIGPELMVCARKVLDAVASVSDLEPVIESAGPIGLESKRTCGAELSEQVIEFCGDTFARGGAVLAGPGGGRFVYDLRRRFDLYVKFSPIRPAPQLMKSARVKAQYLEGVDFVSVRDNIAGVYQGRSTLTRSPTEGRIARHEFTYTEAQVRRLVATGAKLAAARRGHVTLVVKAGGAPVISELWHGVAAEVCRSMNLELLVIDADHCAYRMIQRPDAFDVLIAPNLLGDILTDLAAVLLGSRGLSFSGNFSPEGGAVYQTNHGCAHDLTGADRANPAAQLLALAMLLRESFGLDREARRIETALGEVWSAGWRTEDLTVTGERAIGTRAFTERVAQAIAGRQAAMDIA